jgi:endonuclease/exonuclease/phosphatase family metal-dependent hydrolase
MSGPSGAAARVRAVTWNVWWRFGPQWRERQDAIAATLRSVDADIVALQRGVAGRYGDAG